MDCPRCKEKLLKAEQHDVVTHTCGSCSGFLLKQPQLSSILEAVAAELFPEMDIDTNLPKIKNNNEPIKCPSCRLMMEGYGYMGSNKVMLDICSECNWLWLDADELIAASRMYVQTGMRQSAYTNSLKLTDIVTAHMLATYKNLGKFM